MTRFARLHNRALLQVWRKDVPKEDPGVDSLEPEELGGADGSLVQEEVRDGWDAVDDAPEEHFAQQRRLFDEVAHGGGRGGMERGGGEERTEDFIGDERTRRYGPDRLHSVDTQIQ